MTPPFQTVIVTGAAGALGRAYVRALAAAGHTVRAVDRTVGTIRAFTRRFADAYELPSPADVADIPVLSCDLTRAEDARRAIHRGVTAVVMTAANPLPDQSAASADANHQLDLHTIDAAVEAGVRVIIYTSSVWRLKGLIDGDTLVTPDMAAPESHYGVAKQRTVDAMRSRAQAHPSVRFVVNDHGWYPREATGAPPTNAHDRGMQTWVAERETQQHILQQLVLPDRSDFPGNFHGFLVTSRNVPPEAARRRGHRPFIYDLGPSARLGVEHRANVYDLFESYRTWRDVPIHME